MSNEKLTDKEENKIEVQGGNALIDQFKNLDNKQQQEFLNKIGSNEKDEDEEEKGLLGNVGEAFSNLAGKLETRIGEVMRNPEKRALLYAGLDTIDQASRIKPITQAQSPLGLIAGGLKKGVSQVKGEELKLANTMARSKTRELANQLKVADLQFKMGQETKGESDQYKNILEQNKDFVKGFKNYRNYQQMARLINDQIDQTGNLPVGQLRSQVPVFVQSIAELLPSQLRKDKEFFKDMSNEAAFVKNLDKFTNDIVLGDIGQLVPVSDKDVEIKRSTLPSSKDTAQVLPYSLRTQGAIALLGSKKYDYIGDFRKAKGLRGDKGFEESWESDGSTNFKNEIYDNPNYSKEQIREEAAKLKFEPDYQSYTDGQADFSPLALSEALISLQMGGYDKYSKAGISDIASKQSVTTDESTGKTTTYDKDAYKKDLDDLNLKLKKN